MAANISVTLKMIDQMSQRLEDIACSGDKVANNISSFGERANEAFDNAARGTERINESLQSTSTVTAEYAEQGERARQALENQASSADDAAQRLEGYGDEAEEAGNQSEEFGEKAEESSEKAKDSAMSLGDALAAAGVVLALKQMVEAYNEFDEAADQFESAMAKVSTIADTSAVSIEAIRDDIKKLSSETGIAVTDLSESVYGAISASVDTADAVSFVAQANALAVGGFTETVTSVDILTTALNAYGLEADQTSRIADVLINTQNLGKTSVDELAKTMGMVIPTAAAYNVNLENLASSYAIMTAKGVNTANSTTQLNTLLAELADSGSTVAEILVEQTGKSFADLMQQGYSLGDVIDIIGESVEGDAVAFGNLWNSAVAGMGALTLFNSGAEKFNDVLDQMENSAGAADIAFEKMTDTGEYVDQKWQNALQNLKIAIGDAQPSLDGLMEAGTEIVGRLTDFVEAHPQVVSAIEGIALAVGIFTVGVTAYTLASGLAAKATLVLTAAMDTNPIFLAATAIAAVTAGLVVLISSLEETESYESRLTAASQELSDKIDRQEAEVASLTEKYGENSEKTLAAKGRLEELKAEFEETSQTIGEFKAQVQASTDAAQKSMAKYDELSSSIQQQGMHAQTLIAELENLQNQSELTTFQREYEKQVIEELNNLYPEFNLMYDESSGKVNKSTEYLKEYCKQKQEQIKLEQDARAYIEYMEEMAELEAQMEIAQQNLTQATDEYNAKLENHNDILGTFLFGRAFKFPEEDAMKDAQNVVAELANSMSELQGKMDELDPSANDAADSINEVGDAAANVIDTTEGLKTAMEGIFDNVSEQAEELADAYQEAYDSAASAVDSSFGLFEKIELETTQSAQDMVYALKSQAEYLDEYTANIEKAREYGLDSNLIESLSDGSQESAAALDTIIEKIEDLGGSTDKAKEYITDMNESFKKVEESKKTLEDTMVEMNTTLQSKMEELKNSVENGVENLNLSDEASDAAKKTLEAYISEIERQESAAVSAAEKVASAVAKSLSKTKVGSSITGHADGTTYGENVYIAGENGPELIVGREGSEVFPASETAKILSAVMNARESETDIQMAPQEITTIIHENNETSTNTENRNLTLTIKGKGALDIGQSVSRKDLMNFIQEELEGAIMNIISKEVYEEGEIAYEF